MTISMIIVVLSTLIVSCCCQHLHNNNNIGNTNKVETIVIEPAPDLTQPHPQLQQQQQKGHDVDNASTTTATTINDDDYTDFDVSPLAPNEIQHVKWSDNYDIVAPNTYRLGLSPRIRQGLLEYADRVGVIKFMEQTTFGGMSNPPDTGRAVTLPFRNKTRPNEDEDDDEEEDDDSNNDSNSYLSWYVQRPSPAWRSNMHWVSPGGPETQSTFLQTLSDAGFDDVLDSIGQKLFAVEDENEHDDSSTSTVTSTSNGLVVYQVTFIGVSECSHGFMHADFHDTHPEPNKTRAFNIIIPLIIPEEEEDDEDANDTPAGNGSEPAVPMMSAGLELASRSYDEDGTIFNEIGYLKYKYDEAVMLGDDADHATSPVLHKNAMRLAATIYIADVNEDNYKNFPCNQPYPPVKTNPSLLLDIAGRDWHPTDPTRRLPKRSDAERSNVSEL